MQANGATRRCWICRRALELDQFLTITERKKRGERVYQYVKPSYDCRVCRAELKREGRRVAAQRQGRVYVTRAEAKLARERHKAQRLAAWGATQEARRLARGTTPEEREQVRRSKIARKVARQRERRHTDPEYQAARYALKVRRKRAKEGTQVEVVNREIVAERDGWRCGICGGEVTRKTWSLDHVTPLSKGGPHTYANVVLAHRSCNSSKGNRTPIRHGSSVSRHPDHG